MVRIFALLLSFLYCVNALDVTINYGKEAREHFSVLNITHKDPLACSEQRNAENEVLYAVCTLNQTPIASFAPTETLFFRFWSRIVEGKFYLYVQPKHKIRLFATPYDLKKDVRIPKEQPKESRSWQVIGYINEIPFLNESPIKGLNFPIKIIKNREIFLTDLDIDRGPLQYEEGEDFNAYNQIKKLMNSHSHIEAVKLIDETLIAFPETIFTKDLLLFRMRALEHFDAAENSDMLIDMGTKWIKRYPTDASVPEVLYYLGNAYADLRNADETKYYFERIINEYPQSRYMPLAKMSLAKHFHTGSDAQVAARLFSQAYQEAKDLDSASAIAIEWSDFRIQNNEKEQAQKLLEAMLKANPSYITKYPIKNYEFLKLLAENQMYLIAANLGEYLFEHLQNEDISKEDLLNDVSLWYQAANQVQDAHRINKIFLQEFEHRPKTEEVRERDDKLLFDLAQEENPDEKIQKYDYIIQNYDNSPEKDKALGLKAQTLFDEGQYESVLAMKESIKNSPLIAQSYLALIQQSLKDNDCKQASTYYTQSPQVEIPKDSKMPLFDCLYDLALNKEAAKIAKDMAQDSNDLPQKLAWLYRDALNFAKLGDTKSVARAGRDALELAKNQRNPKYYDVGFVLFDALYTLNNTAEALDVYAFLKANLADDQRMFPIDLTLLKASESQKEELGIELYAKDILRLQTLHRDTTDSPYVDFALTQSYIRTQRFNDAISVLDNLLKKDLNADNQQKALYLKGSILKSINAESKPVFEQCVGIAHEGAWKSLCAQALEILP